MINNIHIYIDINIYRLGWQVTTFIHSNQLADLKKVGIWWKEFFYSALETETSFVCMPPVVGCHEAIRQWLLRKGAWRLEDLLVRLYDQFPDAKAHQVRHYLQKLLEYFCNNSSLVKPPMHWLSTASAWTSFTRSDMFSWLTCIRFICFAARLPRRLMLASLSYTTTNFTFYFLLLVGFANWT